MKNAIMPESSRRKASPIVNMPISASPFRILLLSSPRMLRYCICFEYQYIDIRVGYHATLSQHWQTGRPVGLEVGNRGVHGACGTQRPADELRVLARADVVVVVQIQLVEDVLQLQGKQLHRQVVAGLLHQVNELAQSKITASAETVLLPFEPDVAIVEVEKGAVQLVVGYGGATSE